MPEIMNGLIKLESLESQVEHGFISSAKALREIKETKLYKSGYGTWENYLKDRWGYSSGWYRQLQSSYRVLENLKSVNNINILPTGQLQALELAPLNPAQQSEVWERVTEKYEPREITAQKIKEIKQEILEPEVEVIENIEKDDKITLRPDLMINSENPVIQALQLVYKQALEMRVKQSFLNYLAEYINSNLDDYGESN